jgi:hypothetical protein
MFHKLPIIIIIIIIILCVCVCVLIISHMLPCKFLAVLY